ncbi:MAG: hypothetical protein H6740_13625 [Alphaproteobacteria bacterium]|nr:hypothetical protein [Alphaproteobacteria bacterium]
MLALLLLACVPPDMLGAPLPETYAPTATHYRTDTLPEAQLAPLEVQVLDKLREQAGRTGQSLRVDAALTEVARVIAFRQWVDELDPDSTLTRQLALSLGSPLPAYSIGTLFERRGRLEFDQWAALLDDVGQEVAVGIGAWDAPEGRASSIYIVLAQDGLSLDAPVPMSNPSRISGTWSGETGLMAYTDPGITPLGLSEGPGPFSLDVPEGVTRVDLSTRDGVSTPAAWLDFQGAAPAGPLPEGKAPEDKVLAGFNALREAAGLDALTAVEGPEPCRSWPKEIEGRPVTGNQRCSRVSGGMSVEEWWSLFAVRPYTRSAVLDPHFQWANIVPNASWHLYEPFEALSPEQAEAQAQATFQRLWPGVVLDQTASVALREAATLGAGSAPDAVEQGLARLREVELPFKGQPTDLYYAVNVAERYEDLLDGFAEETPCLRVGVGYAAGPDAKGTWWHVLASFCAVESL